MDVLYVAEPNKALGENELALQVEAKGRAGFRTSLPRALMPICVGGLILAFVVAVVIAPQSTLSYLGLALAIGILLATLWTVAIGVAITAVVAPLSPVSDTSILGRRAVGFAKFALATAALFGTLLVGWMMNLTYESSFDAERFGESNFQMLQVLSLPVALAAIVFWMWLSVDLLRIGARRRRNAIDRLARQVHVLPHWLLHAVRKLAHDSMSTWWWIVGAFYIAPVFVVFATSFAFVARS